MPETVLVSDVVAWLFRGLAGEHVRLYVDVMSTACTAQDAEQSICGIALVLRVLRRLKDMKHIAALEFHLDCGYHFKNHIMLASLGVVSQQRGFALQAVRFASAGHGKGPCDSRFGMYSRRIAAYVASSQLSECRDFMDALRELDRSMNREGQELCQPLRVHKVQSWFCRWHKVHAGRPADTRRQDGTAAARSGGSASAWHGSKVLPQMRNNPYYTGE